MTEYDFEIALFAWVTSLIAAVFFPMLLPAVAATTFNLWHQTNVNYKAGDEFIRRVNKVIAEKLAAFEKRIEMAEKKAVDMTETHTKMAATFTGRALPR